MSNELIPRIEALTLRLPSDRAAVKKKMVASMVATVVGSAAGYLSHWAATGGTDSRQSRAFTSAGGKLGQWVVDNHWNDVVRMYESGRVDPKALAALIWDMRHANLR